MLLDASRIDELVEILLEDEERCLANCRAQGGGVGFVPLVEGLVTVHEALLYARVLAELGQFALAREIVTIVAGGMAAGCVLPNSGTNGPVRVRAQGVQGQ